MQYPALRGSLAVPLKRTSAISGESEPDQEMADIYAFMQSRRDDARVKDIATSNTIERRTDMRTNSSCLSPVDGAL